MVSSPAIVPRIDSQPTRSIAEAKETLLLTGGLVVLIIFAFLVGAVFSALAGFIGMRIATKANVRTAAAAMLEGQAKALRVAFMGGAVMGLAVAALLSRYLGTMLFGVSPLDPWVFGGTALLIAAVALAATLIPARRAMRVQPMVALREE